MSEESDDELPVRPRRDQLEELEPHQRTIERVADVYYRACRSVAKTIRTVKEQLDGDD
ncbi:MAG: hypothetical protein ABEL76_04335 [Bradymonadaceae bacterium]